MHCAATMSDGLIKSLLEREHHINSMTNNGHSPLCYTLKAKRWDLVDTMLNNGARIYSGPVYYAIDNNIPTYLLIKMLKLVKNYKRLLINKNETMIICLMLEKRILTKDIARIPAIKLMIQHLSPSVLPIILKANSVELLQCYLEPNPLVSSTIIIELLDNNNNLQDKVIEMFVGALLPDDDIFKLTSDNNISRLLIRHNRLELTKTIALNPNIRNLFKNQKISPLDYAISLGRLNFVTYLITKKVCININEDSIRYIRELDQSIIKLIYCNCGMVDSVLKQVGELITDKYQCAIDIVGTRKLDQKAILRKVDNIISNYAYVDNTGKTLDWYCRDEYILTTIRNKVIASS